MAAIRAARRRTAASRVAATQRIQYSAPVATPWAPPTPAVAVAASTCPPTTWCRWSSATGTSGRRPPPPCWESSARVHCGAGRAPPPSRAHHYAAEMWAEVGVSAMSIIRNQIRMGHATRRRSTVDAVVFIRRRPRIRRSPPNRISTRWSSATMVTLS